MIGLTGLVRKSGQIRSIYTFFFSKFFFFFKKKIFTFFFRDGLGTSEFGLNDLDDLDFERKCYSLYSTVLGTLLTFYFAFFFLGTAPRHGFWTGDWKGKLN